MVLQRENRVTFALAHKTRTQNGEPGPYMYAKRLYARIHRWWRSLFFAICLFTHRPRNTNEFPNLPANLIASSQVELSLDLKFCRKRSKFPPVVAGCQMRSFLKNCKHCSAGTKTRLQILDFDVMSDRKRSHAFLYQFFDSILSQPIWVCASLCKNELHFLVGIISWRWFLCRLVSSM